MTDNNGQNGGAISKIIKELTQPFSNLAHTSRTLFRVNLSAVHIK